tara:strand:+ start:1405 stop:1812 length:408 start_codon:yes stop_codon:yes gene_type:complete
MAQESSVRAGSGISVFREGMTPGSDMLIPGMRGVNNVVINYEDINSKVGIVQASGLTVVADAVHIAGPTTRLRGRRQLLIQNLGAGVLYIGGSTVTVADGVRVASGDTLTLDVLDVGDIYAISSAVSDVRVLELK